MLEDCSVPRAFSVSRSSVDVAEGGKAGDLSRDKYRVVTVKDAKSLGASFARPAPQRDFIFTTWQGSNAFTRFWFSHLVATGARKQVLMLTFSPGDCRGLPSANCVVHEQGDLLRLMGERTVPPDDGGMIPGGALAVVSKWIWIKAFTESGYNVLFSDSDVAFLRNPLDYWWRQEHRSFDIMGLSDWRPAGQVPLEYCDADKRELSCQSTGIMFFRAGEKVQRVLEGMVREASPPGRTWEQKLWQKFIPQFVHQYSGNYTLLPTSDVTNLEFVDAARPTAVAVHMGYVHGGCNKMRSFWCLGLGITGMERDLDTMCDEQ